MIGETIGMKINNGRAMQLVQKSFDGTITLETYETKTGITDYEGNISPGDMVMLINYYRHQKENNLPIF
jgi:hypothetical protein